jgi:manganese oxidase
VNVCGRLTVWAVTGALLATSPMRENAAAQNEQRRAAGEVVVNDNTRPSGSLDGGTVTIRLRAAKGTWRPEGPSGPGLTIEAFGIEGEPLSVPAPLIRVKEGDVLAVSIRNELEAPLRINGLCRRDGSPCAPIEVAPGATRDVRFPSGEPGTYHYWATTMGAPVPFRELAGALIIDPRDGQNTADRIFVITEWNSLTLAQLQQILASDDSTATFVSIAPKLTFTINGLSWPATERLTYRQGEAVHWRVINLSSQAHPMHLHGFYFTVKRMGAVKRMGDGHRDQAVGDTGRRVVTQVLPAGGTLSMEWIPEREGNWLFHCHIMSHVSPDRRLADAASPADAHAAHGPEHHTESHDTPPLDASLGMAGMVLGITVLPVPDASDSRAGAKVARRKLTMVIQPVEGTGGTTAGFAVSEDGVAVGAPVSSPGPVVVLRRDEPVEITVVNRLDEATSMHWHGLELESIYDGVHGWSGNGKNLAPMIRPGGSFIVRITPPRSGTFIYHTHLHDYRQLSSGLYGPLIVTEPGETYDPATDHVIVLGRSDVTHTSSLLEDAETVVMNGARALQLTWRAGARNRIRLVNITPDDILNVSLVARDTPVTWRPLTKDGAPVPEGDAPPVPARVRIAVGETFDFEYDAPKSRSTLWLDVRGSAGKWLSQGQVIVK